MTENCGTCRYWRGDGGGICHRYPKPEYKTPLSWCGEFKTAKPPETVAVDPAIVPVAVPAAVTTLDPPKMYAGGKRGRR